MTSKLPWPREYYGLLEHYYWEPQWLNRHANAKSTDRTISQVFDSLNRAEVPLNHILNLFFSIAPHSLVSRFFTEYLAGWNPERLETHLRPTIAHIPRIDICQTDLLFEGHTSRIAVEVKIDQKTKLEQVVKYALLLRHYQDDPDGAQKQPFLLYLCRDSVRVWPSGLSFTNFRRAMLKFELTPTIRRFAAVCKHSDADVLAIAAKLPVAHLTYGEFGHFLRGEVQRLDLSDGAETLRNLIGGLLDELESRKLVDAVQEVAS